MPQTHKFKDILFFISSWPLLVLSLTLADQEPKAPETTFLLEAESFDSTGGWVVDQQFMDIMGSPYLLAHGLGEPVKDATATFQFPEGSYRVWVRTRDWVAPWGAPGTPGRFKIIINGQALKTTFGTRGKNWHWQYGGEVDLTSTDTTIAIHDLTGFEGRVDALVLSRDKKFKPPETRKELDVFRSRQLGWSHQPVSGGHFDLIVVGGGLAGTCAALVAARLGLKVALIQDRPVLGGNSSSEVRVGPEGKTRLQPYSNIGDVVEELCEKKIGNAKDAHRYDDQRKLHLVQKQKNITLYLEQRVNNASSKNNRITSVIAQHIRSARRIQLTATLFLDSTGDGVLGHLVGADYEMTEKGHMGASNLWKVDDVEANEYQIKCGCKDKDPLSLNFVKSSSPIPFPRCPWAIDLSRSAFPGRKNFRGQWGGKNPLNNLGAWFWESGFNKEPIQDMEWIRDQNFRAMFGAWDTLKNIDKLYPNHRIKWAAFIAGKRESRRLLGDILLTGDDFRQKTKFKDGSFPCTWHLDLHHAHPDYDKGLGDEAFISKATEGRKHTYQGPYWAPYRCLYSRNINNLFMAGRNISVTHEALGAVRVMRTTGMMGEIVGMAASICIKKKCTPREIYHNHLKELQSLMTIGGSQKAFVGKK